MGDHPVCDDGFDRFLRRIPIDSLAVLFDIRDVILPERILDGVEGVEELKDHNSSH